MVWMVSKTFDRIHFPSIQQETGCFSLGGGVGAAGFSVLWVFSSCTEWGPSPAAVWASRLWCFSCWGTAGSGSRQAYKGHGSQPLETVCSIVEAHELSSSEACGIFQTKGWTCVPNIYFSAETGVSQQGSTRRQFIHDLLTIHTVLTHDAMLLIQDLGRNEFSSLDKMKNHEWKWIVAVSHIVLIILGH